MALVEIRIRTNVCWQQICIQSGFFLPCHEIYGACSNQSVVVECNKMVYIIFTRKFDDRGLPWKLYGDDLVVMADSEDDLKRKTQRWENRLEAKGLRVNVGEMKVMKCEVGLQKVVDSGKYPCGECGKSVDENSIQCTLCMKWVHKCCSGFSRKLKAEGPEAFNCRALIRFGETLCTVILDF